MYIMPFIELSVMYIVCIDNTTYILKKIKF